VTALKIACNVIVCSALFAVIFEIANQATIGRSTATPHCSETITQDCYDASTASNIATIAGLSIFLQVSIGLFSLSSHSRVEVAEQATDLSVAQKMLNTVAKIATFCVLLCGLSAIARIVYLNNFLKNKDYLHDSGLNSVLPLESIALGLTVLNACVEIFKILQIKSLLASPRFSTVVTHQLLGASATAVEPGGSLEPAS